MADKNVFGNNRAEGFYQQSLRILNKSKIPYMVGGTFAVVAYTGIRRPTKDMDIFCKAGDYPKILEVFAAQGFKTNVEDERWLAKVHQDRYFFDIIYNSGNAATPVNDQWLQESQKAKIYDIDIKILPVTELIFSKVFIQARVKYDGADIAHLILLKYKHIDWKRLLSYMDQNWEVLLIHLLNFRFVYPSEREVIPRWLLDELLGRLESQMDLPTSKMKICRGRLFSGEDYEIDVKEWGFADLVGGKNEPRKSK